MKVAALCLELIPISGSWCRATTMWVQAMNRSYCCFLARLSQNPVITAVHTSSRFLTRPKAISLLRRHSPKPLNLSIHCRQTKPFLMSS